MKTYKQLMTELKDSTLSSYITKAAGSLQKKAYDSGAFAGIGASKGIPAKDNPYFKTAYDKSNNRVKGIARAVLKKDKN
jgi:hypothetical protein